MQSKGANRAITAIMWTLWLAIIVLLGLLIVVIGKLVSIPPCTVIGQNACAVDGWTVSGISANILAVGGTVLTVLAALAVTAWWVKLDDRIAVQVADLVRDNMEAIRQKQERELREYVEQAIDEQRDGINEAFTQKDQEIQRLTLQLESVQRIFFGHGTELLKGIIKHHNPWDLEEWAREIELQSSSLFYEAAWYMSLSYLHVVDGFQADPEKQKERLRKKGIDEQYNTPLEFWKSASWWEQKVKGQGQTGYVASVEHEMNQRRAFIESWKSRNPSN